MAKKVAAPIYWRNERAYLDARAYADVGGGQERLVAFGEKLATTDPVVARDVAARRIKELESLRRDRALHGVTRRTTLAAFAQYHLQRKAEAESVTDQWLESAQLHLECALAYFGDCDLLTITVVRVQDYATHLTTLVSRGNPLGPGTRRKYLNSLSNLFRRAQAEGYVAPGYNPVAAMLDKPKDKAKEAAWLEIHLGALLLEACQLYVPDRSDGIPIRMLYALIATFLLTGGRETEVLGLCVADVNFERKTVTFRENRWRRLKSANARRVVPLWPQLEMILRQYISEFGVAGESLLFPSPRMKKEAMITDFRKPLDAAAALAGWAEGEVRSKALRHTYCSTRLQTLDGGAPVSEFTVAREMGHGGAQLVRRIYGHLGRVRHRSEFVEYRLDQHAAELGERLVDLHRRARRNRIRMLAGR